ncbi:MAG: hypothetical protein HY549_05770 [Elusimicrobia bacterium]|nr:hypothetical protein [Elusimicrobiota bacterium]
MSMILAFSGCGGSVPRTSVNPDETPSGIAIGGRFITGTGETRAGSISVMLRGEGGRERAVYRVPVDSQRPMVYALEPGKYALSEPRSSLGSAQDRIRVEFDGRSYDAPFPRDFLRKPPVELEAGKVLCLGAVEAKLISGLPGREPSLTIRLDDSFATRRELLERLIKDMVDPSVPAQHRNNLLSWSRSLNRSFSELLAEEKKPTRP